MIFLDLQGSLPSKHLHESAEVPWTKGQGSQASLSEDLVLRHKREKTGWGH